jgi:hypothetical protein
MVSLFYAEQLILQNFSWEKGTLTAERRQHILQHSETVEGTDKIGDVLAHPEWVFVPDLTPDQS